MAERLTFDTNVFWHGMLPSTDSVAPTCRRLLQAVDDGELNVPCSTLVLVELPKVLAPQYPIEELVALTENLRSSAVEWVPVTESIAIKARELARTVDRPCLRRRYAGDRDRGGRDDARDV